MRTERLILKKRLKMAFFALDKSKFERNIDSIRI